MKFRLIKAIAVSGMWMALRLDFRDCLTGLFGIAKFTALALLGKDRAPTGLESMRNTACRGCQMFDINYGTCGIPGDVYENPHTGKIEAFGCWCVTEVANKSLSKDCWGRVHDDYFPERIGWDEKLRPRQSP